MSGYMDIDEFMDVLENAPKDSSSVMHQKPNYDILLQSIASLGKMIDKADSKGFQPQNSPTQSQDLTADLFSSMTDSEMLSHFIPVRGIDYDQNYLMNDDVLKKDGKEQEIISDVPNVDDFLPHRMIPNPVYKIGSAFKSVIPTPKKQSVMAQSIQAKELKRKQSYEVIKPQEPIRKPKNVRKVIQRDEEDSEESETETEESKQLPRIIKRRKPRTYKYNPKPLQHKECRSFVPDDLKDIDYWERRKRNNEAAKKSREERRKKELEVLNSYEMMKQEYSQIKIENIRLKARNSVLEKQVTELKKKVHDTT